MRNTFRRTVGGAVTEYEIASRQVRLKAWGLVTPAVLSQITADLDRIAAGWFARSIVIDWTSSILAVPWETLLASPGNLSQRVRHLPLAVVPPIGSEELLRAFAWEQAQRGLLRAAHSATEAAQAWAARHERAAEALRRIRESA